MKDIRSPIKGYSSEPGSVETVWNFIQSPIKELQAMSIGVNNYLPEKY
jgi:hypothetical protein